MSVTESSPRHPCFGTFDAADPAQARRWREQRLRQRCRDLGATTAEVAACATVGELFELRSRKTEQLMAAADGAA